jgi:hypothetical protein
MLKYKSFSYFLALGASLATIILFSGYPFRWILLLANELSANEHLVALSLFGILFLIIHLLLGSLYGNQQKKRSLPNTDEVQNTAQSFDYQLALQRSIIVWGGVSLLFDFAYAIYVMGTSGGAGSGLSITDILLPALFISTLFITLGFFYNLNVVKEERKCPKCSAAWSMLCRESILTDTSMETHNRKEEERKVTNNRTYHRDIFYEIDCTYSHFDEFHECIKCRYEEIRKRIESSEMQHTKKVTAVGEWTWSRY